MANINEAQMRFDFDEVEDSLGDEDEIVPFKYSISSYGADYVVDSLVKRLERGDIYIPSFQRKFIWNLKQSSRFIESLLLGLPVPSIFLSKDDETKKLLVIDGQQRLRTLQYFYDGVFADTDKEFVLDGVQSQFRGKAYKTLSPEDRRQLDDSILHAIIIRQDSPEDDENTSVYYIFERLNTTGTPLTSQEIRATIYRGELNQLLEELNQYPSWRSIYGSVNQRRRDQEFILRFLALYFYEDEYSPPMKQFLNRYMSKNRHLKFQSADALRNLFTKTIDAIYKSIGKKAFRPIKGFNAAVFDAVMVGVARRLEEKGSIQDNADLQEKYEILLGDPVFLNAIETGTTASVNSVNDRIIEAIKVLREVK